MYDINIIYRGKTINTKESAGENVMDILRRMGINIPADCGGDGRCKKCAVWINEEQMLACKAYIHGDTTVKIIHSLDYGFSSEPMKLTAGRYGVGIDIGTTTIAFRLIELCGAADTTDFTILNSQIKYGGDVISRITNANNGKLLELCDLIREDLTLGMQKICGVGIDIERVVIAANTVMVYLLSGFSCDKLSVYPFEFVTGKTMETDALSGSGCGLATVLPSASAFVGGDVLSGIIFAKLYEKNNSMLIDIGTNSEIVLNGNGDIICTSAAAGPAFEGGNISCGTGSVNGAVCSVKYADGKFNVTTIGDVPPIGICGSGLIDAVCCLAENSFIDKTGLLLCDENKIEICDGIYITQEDIRQLQLAKSAIRSSTELLLEKAMIDDAGKIEHVFISGLFGQNINVENAVSIGLIPKAFSDKITVCSNTALGGTEAIIKNKISNEFLDTLAVGIKTIDISKDGRFNDLFIEYIDF